MPTPTYEAKDGRIFQRYVLETGGKLLLTSRDVRRERTGVHACIELFLNQVVLAYDTFNIDRNEERVRLANSAHAQMSEIERGAWSKADMKHALDEFLIGLWPQHLNLAATKVETDYDMSPALPDYLLEPYLLRGAGTILFGPPKRGKSTTAMLMAICADAGLSWPWKAYGRVPSIYINLERSAESLYRRVGRCRETLGLPEDYSLPLYNARGRSLIDVAEGVREAIRKRGTELVVLDSISRAGYGNLNDNEVGNKVADVLNGLGVGWLAIGHTSRADDTHVFGTQMFDAAADVLVSITSEQRPDALGIGLKVTDANDIPMPAQQTWAYEFDEYGLAGIRGAKEGEFFEVAEKQGTPEQRLASFLLGYGEASISEAATALRMSYPAAAKLLNEAEAAQIVRCRFESGPAGGRPVKRYSMLARNGHSDESEGFFSANKNSEKKGVSLSKERNPTPFEKNPPEKNPRHQWDPCDRCRRLAPPERYTPEGNPLCVSCADDER